MEKNTLILDLDEYNELRDFKTTIEKGNVVCKIQTNYWQKQYLTTSDALDQLSTEINSISEKNKILIDEMTLLKNEQNNKLQKAYKTEIDKLAKMNWFEFRKWKKNYK